MSSEGGSERYDLAVFGSGFGGSLLALIARRLGLTVLLVERGRHPRFAIGESTSPLANLILEDLAVRYDLPRILPLTSFGPWQRHYPEIVCGLKRGFTYYAQTPGEPFQSAPHRENELIVAASPNRDVADTHWLRSDVDAFLMGEATSAGAVYKDHCEAGPLDRGADGTWTFILTDSQGTSPTSARFVVDATGPRGSLSRSLPLAEAPFSGYPATQALYTHFRGVQRCDSMPQYQHTAIPPYPPDDAALHHVFRGGWMWVLRFGNGVTSAGVAVTDEFAREIGLADGAAAWARLLKQFPTVAEQFAGAQPVRPFVHAPRLAYRAQAGAGPGWALLPSAAAFVDPLFSTGIPLALLGVERLATILEDAWDGPSLDERLQDYGRATLADADSTADFISACYAVMGDFHAFSALSMFYFAAASYSEVARRLKQPHLAGGFLGRSHPRFGPSMRRITESVRRPGAGIGGPELDWEVAAAIECLNIAGLCDPGKRNWYGVDLDDVVTGAAKLGMTPDQMRAILRDAPWAQPNSL